MSLVPKKGGEGNGDAANLHPEQIPPPHTHLRLPPLALWSAPHRPICPPVPPTSFYLVSCLPRIPFRPLGTTPLPLGCAVQPIIQLLVLPRVLSPSVKPEPPTRLSAGRIREPHFSSGMPQSFLFSSQCAPEPPAHAQVSGLLCFIFWCIPSGAARSLSLLTGLQKKKRSCFQPSKE